MSVVVYHNGVMAADSRAYSGTSHPVGEKNKAHRIERGPYAGSLLGITSNQVGMAEAFREWIEKGASRDDMMPGEPCLTALHVLANGEVYLYSDGYTPAGPLTGPTFTIGSGRKYALGAIEMGADAVRAVKAAIRHDMWCGGPIRVLTLTGAPDIIAGAITADKLRAGAIINP